MNSSLLVSHVDDLDPFVETTFVERHDVTTRQGEDDFDASLFESLGCELSSGKRHWGVPFVTWTLLGSDSIRQFST
jgi:hypothetical protein